MPSASAFFVLAEGIPLSFTKNSVFLVTLFLTKNPFFCRTALAISLVLKETSLPVMTTSGPSKGVSVEFTAFQLKGRVWLDDL